MKYYRELAKMPVFTFNEAMDAIGGNKKTSKVLDAMIHDGSIHRIRRDLYSCFDFGNGDDYASRFQIASKVNQCSFISFHSAFEFYGFYNQSYFEVQVCSMKRFSNFSYGDYRYRWFMAKTDEQIRNIQGVRVVTIERAIVDSIHMLGKVIDAEELVKCLNLLHMIDEDNILKMLHVYDQERLYRKVGYVLSFYRDDLRISDNFFATCKKRGVLLNKGYLVKNDKNCLVFDSEWGLYAYGDMKRLAYKGGEEDV